MNYQWIPKGFIDILRALECSGNAFENLVWSTSTLYLLRGGGKGKGGRDRGGAAAARESQTGRPHPHRAAATPVGARCDTLNMFDIFNIFNAFNICNAHFSQFGLPWEINEFLRNPLIIQRNSLIFPGLGISMNPFGIH